ncbi:MAG: class I SAM-dependent methyltransferase [Candidatus Hydrogenedentota bacterium]
MQAIKFFKEFLAAPVHVGALAASSRYLAEMTAGAAELETASVVVEFGPGTGVITEKILAMMPQDAKLMTIEIREDFAKIMWEKYPEVTTVHGGAEETARHLQEHFGVQHCDRIVSGLPWAAFDEALQDRLLDAMDEALEPGGRFVTYTYFQSPLLAGGKRFRQKLHERFSEVGETRMIWLNLPPAFVYWAVK